jgi:hypothetical protein
VQSWQLLSPQTFGLVALVASLAVLALRLRQRDPAAFVRLAPLVAMGLLGPIVFYVHWPWLWYHPVDRLAWYFDFHATHVHYAWTYFGDVLRAPPFPLAYVFVVTALTLPVSLVLPMTAGLVRTWVLNLGDLVPALGRRFGRGGPTEWLLGVNALFSILLISHPEVPHFGGVKHWLPSMPFLALLAGREFDRAAAGLSSALRLTARRGTLASVALGGSSCFRHSRSPCTSTRTARPLTASWPAASPAPRASGSNVSSGATMSPVSCPGSTRTVGQEPESGFTR